MALLVMRILVLPLLLRIVYAKSLMEDAAITASMDYSGPWSEIAASLLAERNLSSTLDAMDHAHACRISVFGSTHWRLEEKLRWCHAVRAYIKSYVLPGYFLEC